jgi:hypothetical protein
MTIAEAVRLLDDSVIDRMVGLPDNREFINAP